MPAGTLAWKRLVGALLLFGISFGYVEAAGVVYLNSIYSPSPQQPNHPVKPIELLIWITSAGPANHARLRTEMFREGATLIVLAAVALVAARSTEQWLAAFLVAFGAWDISYYAFLKALVGWPQSVLNEDVLFLLPVPWAAPVLAPVIVSISMIAAGTVLLRRDHNGHALRLGRFGWAMTAAAGLILVLSFTWDFRSLTAGRQPQTFRWLLFGFGEFVGWSGLLHCFWQTSNDSTKFRFRTLEVPPETGKAFQDQ